MKTIQMTIDEPLLEEVDRVVEQRSTTRSAFIREALKAALDHYRRREMEDRHARGYAEHPLAESEFEAWIAEQHWGDE
jgi:metal-responsive CopG/Arc/MetJ family transcriptional regulator